MPKCDLDAIDCRIITALQANGRLSNIELAEKVGLSASPCLRRVRRLEKDGYIEAYRAALQRNRVGLGFPYSSGSRLMVTPMIERWCSRDPSWLCQRSFPVISFPGRPITC